MSFYESEKPALRHNTQTNKSVPYHIGAFLLIFGRRHPHLRKRRQVRENGPANPGSELSLLRGENTNVHLLEPSAKNIRQTSCLTSEAGASSRSSLKRRSPGEIKHQKRKTKNHSRFPTYSWQHCCSSSQVDLLPQGCTQIHINPAKQK